MIHVVYHMVLLFHININIWLLNVNNKKGRKLFSANVPIMAAVGAKWLAVRANVRRVVSLYVGQTNI